jgi:hypothetical protein
MDRDHKEMANTKALRTGPIVTAWYNFGGTIRSQCASDRRASASGRLQIQGEGSFLSFSPSRLSELDELVSFPNTSKNRVNSRVTNKGSAS